MLWGKRQITIFIIVILGVTLFPIFQFPPSAGDLSNPSVLVPHNPISINGDSGFTSTNGVVSGAGTKNDPYIIENWSISASTTIGIYIYDTSVYFIIRNCYIYNGNSSHHGIYFYKCDHGIIENNRIISNKYGIYISDSNYCIIRNNTCNFSKANCIYIYRSDHNLIINNTCEWNLGTGIYNYYSDYNTIINNTCRLNSGHGICIDESDYISVLNNTYDSNYQTGITNSWTDHNTIINNSCSNNSKEGIIIYYSSNNKFNNNTISNNSAYGIYIYDCSSNIFANNTIKNNANYGIYLSESLNNLFYNNYINNNKNYLVNKYNISFKNTWNILKTPGRNIVGGPYLGGNYWSDYMGYDDDQDRLGDTNLPHGPGDYHPLIMLSPPKITDNTLKIPTTGDQFVFNGTVFANGKVKSVNIEYYFDQSPSKNETMNLRAGNSYLGTYTLNITILDQTFGLFYFFSANDEFDNWGNSKIKMLKVIDNDGPIIDDYTSSEPITGENFRFNASIIDNINLTDVHLEFWFDHGVHQNITLISQSKFYCTNTTVPSNAKKLRYTISALDNSSNCAPQKLKTLYVTDNIHPNIIDNSGTPTTGDNFSFSFDITDNIEVLEVFLEYWFDERPSNKVTLPTFPERPIYHIIIPPDAFVLHSIVTTIDVSNNIEQLEIKKSIIDNDLPVINELMSEYPGTGRIFIFNYSIYENRLIKNASIEYWFNDGESILTSLNFKDNEYYLEVEVPLDSKILRYNITAQDASDNVAWLDNNLDIIDVIPPEIYNLTEEIPTTGDRFEFKASVEDNICVESIYMAYWFDDNYDNIKNITFNNTFIIPIQSNALLLNNILTARDTSDNVRVKEIHLNVKDNDPPIINDEPPTPTTGDEFNLNFKITDNIEVSNIRLEYWFDEESENDHEKIEFGKTGSNNSIVAPYCSKVLHYTLAAEDKEKNTAVINRDIKVIDNDAPIITDYSSKIGDTYRFFAEVIDNIEVSNVKVNYWFENGIINIVNLNLKDGKYEGIITLKDNVKKMNYVISANDTSENLRLINENNIEISIQQHISPFTIYRTFIYWVIFTIIIIIVAVFLLNSVSNRKRAKFNSRSTEVVAAESSMTLVTASVNDQHQPTVATPKLVSPSTSIIQPQTTSSTSPKQMTVPQLQPKIEKVAQVPQLPAAQTQTTTDASKTTAVLEEVKPTPIVPLNNNVEKSGGA